MPLGYFFELTISANAPGVKLLKLASALNLRVGNGNCREQRFRVFVLRIIEEFLCRGELHELSCTHYTNTITEIAYYCKVVCNEKKCKAVFPLKVFEQINNLRLN